jgi:hypothetical protein
MAGGISAQRVVKPKSVNSAPKSRPVSRTPAKFIVPLLTLTVRSRNCSAAGDLSLTAATMRCSTGVSSVAQPAGEVAA